MCRGPEVGGRRVLEPVCLEPSGQKGWEPSCGCRGGRDRRAWGTMWEPMKSRRGEQCEQVFILGRTLTGLKGSRVGTMVAGVREVAARTRRKGEI